MKDHVRVRVAAAIVSWKASLPHSHYFACETRLTWSELAGLILSLITGEVASSPGNDATEVELLICLLSIIFLRAGICSHVDKNSEREIVLTH